MHHGVGPPLGWTTFSQGIELSMLKRASRTIVSCHWQISLHDDSASMAHPIPQILRYALLSSDPRNALLAKPARSSAYCKPTETHSPHNCTLFLASNLQVPEPFSSRPFWLLLTGNHLNHFVAGTWLPQRLHQNRRNLHVEWLLSQTGRHNTLLVVQQNTHSGSCAIGARVLQRWPPTFCDLLTAIHPNNLSGS